jgi:hypothetical protein
VPDRREPTSLPEQVSDLLATAKDYAIQETVDPLRGVLRFVAFGIGGALVGGIGAVLLTLAALRALQTETRGHLSGHLSWIPYLILAAVVAGVLGWVVSRIGKHELAKPPAKRRSRS